MQSATLRHRWVVVAQALGVQQGHGTLQVQGKSACWQRREVGRREVGTEGTCFGRSSSRENAAKRAPTRPYVSQVLSVLVTAVLVTAFQVTSILVTAFPVMSILGAAFPVTSVLVTAFPVTSILVTAFPVTSILVTAYPVTSVLGAAFPVMAV